MFEIIKRRFYKDEFRDELLLEQKKTRKNMTVSSKMQYENKSKKVAGIILFCRTAMTCIYMVVM